VVARRPISVGSDPAAVPPRGVTPEREHGRFHDAVGGARVSAAKMAIPMGV